MIKYFMKDYLGLLAYSDWLRDEGREEEAIAFLDAIAEERGWSEGWVQRVGNGVGGGYGSSDGYSFGDSSGCLFLCDIYFVGDTGFGCGDVYCNRDGDGKGDGYGVFDFSIYEALSLPSTD